jgi:hypothetical protein
VDAPSPDSWAATGPDQTGKYFHAKIAGGQTLTAGTRQACLGDPRGTHLAGNQGQLFAGWQWDGRCLRVSADRYGIYPLFYFSLENEFAVGPSVSALLARLGHAAVDHDAMAVFLRLGFFLDEDTPFQHIRALAPGARLVWEGGKTTCSSARPRHFSFAALTQPGDRRVHRSYLHGHSGIVCTSSRHPDGTDGYGRAALSPDEALPVLLRCFARCLSRIFPSRRTSP